MTRTATGRRRNVIIAISVIVVVAVVAVGAVLLWPKSTPTAGATGSTSSSAPAGTVVDPPVLVPDPKVKPLAVTAGKAPVPAKVAARLAGPLANPNLAKFTGIVVDPATNTVLWKKNPLNAVIPASTLKLLTGAALLALVNPNTRLTTKVVQGEQPGDIVFVGGGDVTLSAASAGVQTVYTGAPTVADLAAQIKKSGVQVKRILLDTSYWTGSDLAPGWLSSDITGDATHRTGFITKMQALMVDGDRTDPSNDNSVRTNQPAMNAGKALARALGTPDLPIVTNETAPAGAKQLAMVQSQPVSILLSQALLSSDNVLAEALGRQVAIADGASPSFDGVGAAIPDVLSRVLKLDINGLVMVDASGMSDHDQATPDLLADVMSLAVNGKVPALQQLLVGLPVAGVSGTLAEDNRFESAASKAGAGWVRAKTGTLDFTYALVGYVPDVDGRILVFSISSNDVSAPTRDAQDVFATALRQCGCS